MRASRASQERRRVAGRRRIFPHAAGARRARQHRAGHVQLLRRPGARLEVDRGQPLLLRQVAVTVGGTGQRLRIVTAAVGERRIERRMRVVDVDAGKPRPFALLADEANRLVGAPRRLVQLGRHAVRVLDQLGQGGAVPADPVGVVVALRPVVARRVAVAPVTVAVVHPRLHLTVGAGQMQLADQRAIVADVCQQACDQRIAVGELRHAVAAGVRGAGIGAGEEAGP